MQIVKTTIAAIISLVAVASTSPLKKRGSDIATYDQCMTIAYDPNQGMAFYNVSESKKAEVASDCRTCIMETAGCSPSGSDSCRAIYLDCAEEMGITLS